MHRDDAWLPPPNPLYLPPAELHVWRATLDPGARTLERLEATLDPDERARAQRFIVAHGSRRFTAARGFLRDVLARYTSRVLETITVQQVTGVRTVQAVGRPSQPADARLRSGELP